MERDQSGLNWVAGRFRPSEREGRPLPAHGVGVLRASQVREDLGNDRRIYDACPEPAEGACPEPAEGAAMIVKGPPHSEQVVMSISNTRFSNSAQVRVRSKITIHSQVSRRSSGKAREGRIAGLFNCRATQPGEMHRHIRM